MKGHIKITDKVKFVYYELPKPDKKIYNKAKLYNFENLIIQKYKASKKTVEVSNPTHKIEKVFIPPMSKDLIDTYIIEDLKTFGKQRVQGGEPCEAEVTDTALITKIL